jgi:O-antigen/teichoic acid export membrane protein
MSSARKIAENTGFLFFTEIFDKLLAFLLIIIIIRSLGDKGYGIYSFMFAFILMFTVVSSLGMGIYMLREIPKHKENRARTQKLINNTLTLELIITAFMFIVAMVITPLWPRAYEVRLGIFLVIIHEIINTVFLLIKMIFSAYERNEFKLYSTIIDKSAALIIAVPVLLKGYGLYTLLMALIAAKIIALVSTYIILSRNIITISPAIDPKFCKGLIRKSIPFWFSIVFITLYYHTDKVMLTAIKGYISTGIYSAASTIINALVFLPVIMVYATFPAMSRFYHTKSERLLKLLYQKSFYYLLLMSIPISIGIGLLAERIVLFLYKEQFLLSGSVLRVLSGVLIFIFVNYIMGYLLNSVNKQKVFAISSSACLLSNVLINLILIPRFDYQGAAYATIIS